MPLRDSRHGHTGLPSHWTILEYVPGIPYIHGLIDRLEIIRTSREPRVMQVVELQPTPDTKTFWDGSKYEPRTIFIYHHQKKGRYIGTRRWLTPPVFTVRQKSGIEPYDLLPIALCSGCGLHFRCVQAAGMFKQEPGCFYWVDPHDSCPKFPHHPEYDLNAIFGNIPRLDSANMGIARIRYLERSWLMRGGYRYTRPDV